MIEIIKLNDSQVPGDCLQQSGFKWSGALLCIQIPPSAIWMLSVAQKIILDQI